LLAAAVVTRSSYGGRPITKHGAEQVRDVAGVGGELASVLHEPLRSPSRARKGLLVPTDLQA
jgi:hypothetical protein